MRAIETWRIAFAALREYRMRAALSTLGVVLGSASIVMVVSVAATARQYVVDQIEGVGANLVYAQRVHSEGDRPATRADELTVADLEAIRTDIRDVVDVAGTRDEAATVVAGGQERGIRLIGVTAGFQLIRNLSVVKGRYFDDDELASGSKVCLLTEDLAARIFPDEDPIGSITRINAVPLTVIGTFGERVSTFGASEIQRESAIVPDRVLASATGQDFLRVLYARRRRGAASHRRSAQVAGGQAPDGRAIRRRELDRAPGGRAPNLGGTDHDAAGRRRHRDSDQRDRDHERDARDGRRENR
jgi:putative ABC transport system permease protein